MILTILCSIGLFSSSAHAIQAIDEWSFRTPRRMDLMVLAGLNKDESSTSNLSNPTLMTPSMSNGFQAGVRVAFFAQSKLQLETGLDLFQIGAERSGMIGPSSQYETLLLTELHLPISGRYHFNRWFSFGLGGFAIGRIGNAEGSQSGSTMPRQRVSYAYSDIGLPLYEFGVELGPRFAFALENDVELMADISVMQGVYSPLTNGVASSTFLILISGGIRFPLL